MTLNTSATCGERPFLALAVEPQVTECAMADHVSLTLTLSNVSDTARYVHGDLLKTLSYGVKDSGGRVVHRFNDPPLPGSNSEYESDLIWLDRRASVRLVQRLELKYLGIFEPGTYSVVASWNGMAATEPQLKSQKWDIAFAFSEPMTITVPSEDRK